MISQIKILYNSEKIFIIRKISLEALTERQKRVLECIVKFQEEHNYPPSIIEICQRLGIRSTNGVAGHIRALIKKGYIEKTSKARTIKITRKAREIFLSKESGEFNQKANLVPLLGLIPAGIPVLSEANIEKMLPIPSEIRSEGVYALKVIGDSMIEDGILDGDIIIVDTKLNPQYGDIVVALVNDEVTVKRYYPQKGIIELKPANKKMASIYIPSSSLIIQGVVIGLQRYYQNYYR